MFANFQRSLLYLLGHTMLFTLKTIKHISEQGRNSQVSVANLHLNYMGIK